MPGCVDSTLETEGRSMTYMWEEDNMRLQKRNGNMPGIVGFAQELDQL